MAKIFFYLHLLLISLAPYISLSNTSDGDEESSSEAQHPSSTRTRPEAPSYNHLYFSDRGPRTKALTSSLATPQQRAVSVDGWPSSSSDLDEGGHTTGAVNLDKYKKRGGRTARFKKVLERRETELKDLRRQLDATIQEGDSHQKTSSALYMQLLKEARGIDLELVKLDIRMARTKEFFNTGLAHDSVQDEEHYRQKQLRQQEVLLELRRDRNELEYKKLEIENRMLQAQSILMMPQEALHKKYHMRAKVVLSLSGGGIRGLLEVVYLKKLLEDIRKRATERGIPNAGNLQIADVIDVVAGTSTGSYIAAAIALRKDLGDIEGIYNQGAHLFQRKKAGAGGVLGPKYRNSRNTRLVKTLRRMTSETTSDGERLIPLSESTVPLIIPSFKVRQRRLHVFSSEDAKQNTSPTAILPTVLDALIASSAAPYYFRSKYARSMDGKVDEHADGGVAGCNNPSLVALTETIRIFEEYHKEYLAPHNIIMMTLGSGQTVTDYPSMRKSSAVGLLGNLIQSLMAGSADMVHQSMKNVLLDGRYFPINFNIGGEHSRLDSYAPASLEHFRNSAADAYVANRDTNSRFIEICLDMYECRLQEEQIKHLVIPEELSDVPQQHAPQQESTHPPATGVKEAEAHPAASGHSEEKILTDHEEEDAGPSTQQASRAKTATHSSPHTRPPKQDHLSSLAPDTVHLSLQEVQFQRPDISAHQGKHRNRRGSHDDAALYMAENPNADVGEIARALRLEHHSALQQPVRSPAKDVRRSGGSFSRNSKHPLAAFTGGYH